MAKEDLLFINKCSFKSSPRSAYYVTVTPYGSDKVLFHPPRGANSQNTIFSQAVQRDASETCSSRDQLRFP